MEIVDINTLSKEANEQKQALLQDLCARLPYGIKCDIDGIMEPMTLETIKYEGEMFVFGEGVYERYITQIKPYLRPMWSMTESEYNEFQKAVMTDNGIHFGCVVQGKPKIFTLGVRALDWLNKNMFDYRGLIQMDLVLPAKDDMYN